MKVCYLFNSQCFVTSEARLTVTKLCGCCTWQHLSAIDNMPGKLERTAHEHSSRVQYEMNAFDKACQIPKQFSNSLSRSCNLPFNFIDTWCLIVLLSKKMKLNTILHVWLTQTSESMIIHPKTESTWNWEHVLIWSDVSTPSVGE